MVGDPLVEQLELLGGMPDRHLVGLARACVGPGQRRIPVAEQGQRTSRQVWVQSLEGDVRPVLGQVLLEGVQSMQYGVYSEEAIRLVELAVGVVDCGRQGLLLLAARHFGQFVQQGAVDQCVVDYRQVELAGGEDLELCLYVGFGSEEVLSALRLSFFRMTSSMALLISTSAILAPRMMQLIIIFLASQSSRLWRR
jgi:hypothetical protein